MRIGVVLGSSRPERLGDRACRFVMCCARDVTDAAFHVIDLASYQLPFFDQVLPPVEQPRPRTGGQLQQWLDDMTAADGYLFVVPEYNYAVPAVVKNALDFLGHEADGNPASVLSYSDTDHGGNIAGHELRLVLNRLGMAPLPKSLPFTHADLLLDRNGQLIADSGFGTKLAAFVPWSLRELVRYAEALRPLRQEAFPG